MITANASTAADDLVVAASGDAAFEGVLENDTFGSAAPRVIFPTGISGEAAEQPQDDISFVLFNNDISDNIPSQHLCPITQKPPFDAVHFDVPAKNGAMIPNQQVLLEIRALPVHRHTMYQERTKEYHPTLHPCADCME